MKFWITVQNAKSKRSNDKGFNVMKMSENLKSINMVIKNDDGLGDEDPPS